MNRIAAIGTAALAVLSFGLWAQPVGTVGQPGELHAIFQFDGQAYVRDSILDPTGQYYPEDKFRGQGFATFTYTQGGLRAGMRYENYQNPILGYPQGFKGQGIPYRFVQFEQDGFDITVGNFYEQFGSGMILRAYEERALGLDNALDGVRIATRWKNGLQIKGVLGKQRRYFSLGEGIVRGVDAEYNLPWKAGAAVLGGSFVSKYQPANDPELNLPANVAAGALRFNLAKGKWSLNSEYVYKANDPSFDNAYIYRPGQALRSTLTYRTKGFSVQASAKRIDNMSFRSDRSAQQFDVFVNFLPPTSKLHTYALPALFPYATQINGEQGGEIDVVKAFSKGSWLGGKTGLTVALNASWAESLQKSPVATGVPIGAVGTDGYRSDWLKRGEIPYFRDVNVEFRKKFSKKSKGMLTLYDLRYNKTVLNDGVADAVLLANPGQDSLLTVRAAVAEFQHTLPNGQTLRYEAQWNTANGFRGDAVMGLVEWTVSDRWTVAVQEIYNYGHPSVGRRIHYPILSLIHFSGNTRIQINYGRQQQGIFCVGGICRVVPPSNGLAVSFTTSF
jgi:hypothetical protein